MGNFRVYIRNLEKKPLFGVGSRVFILMNKGKCEGIVTHFERDSIIKMRFSNRIDQPIEQSPITWNTSLNFYDGRETYNNYLVREKETGLSLNKYLKIYFPTS